MKSGSRGTRPEALYSRSPGRVSDGRQCMRERMTCNIYIRENIEHDEVLQQTRVLLNNDKSSRQQDIHEKAGEMISLAN